MAGSYRGRTGTASAAGRGLGAVERVAAAATGGLLH